MTSFQDFTLNDAITRALAEEKYLTPTPIQAQTIPTVISGRDVIGIAQTGTGKTAAFALPILHRLSTRPRPPARKSCRILVLSPTRELSGQILDSFRSGAIRYPSIVSTGRSIRVFGDMAVVHGSEDDEVVADGKRFNARYLYLDVLQKRNGEWKIVASQLAKPSE